MEFNFPAMLGIGIGMMFFGYFFGLLEGRGQGYKNRKKEEAAEQMTKEAIDAPLRLMAQEAARENPLLKLSLDEASQPRLAMDGQSVDTAQLTTNQRKRLIELMMILRPWVEGIRQPIAPPAATPAVTPPPAAAPTPAPVTPPSPSKSRPAAAGAKKEGPSAAPLSMVTQIDAILQARLLGTSLAERGVRLVESPEGGVSVMVDNKSFAGVGEVPDPNVQAAIRLAIAEWEKRFTPGV
jgi:hypothetical protein